MDTKVLDRLKKKGEFKLASQVEPTEVISTGFFDLDYSILTIGGLPKGRIVELLGPESAGKTLIAYRVVAAAQRMKNTCLWFDVEKSMRDEAAVIWAQKQGVDTDNLIVCKNDLVEDVLALTINAIKSGVSVVVIDSVAAMIPKLEYEGKTSEKDFGQKGRIATMAGVMGQGVKQVGKAADDHNALVIFINQLRDKPGVLFGDTETTPGGRALKHHASIRLAMARIGDIKEGERIVGNYAAAKLVKSRVSPRGRRTGDDYDCPALPIYYDGRPVDEGESVIRLAIDHGLIEQSGPWFSYGGQKYKGREGLLEYLKSNPEEYQKLRDVAIEKTTEMTRIFEKGEE